MYRVTRTRLYLSCHLLSGSDVVDSAHVSSQDVRMRNRLTPKKMICYDCRSKIVQNVVMAKRRGWRVWQGGARCPGCISKESRQLDANWRPEWRRRR